MAVARFGRIQKDLIQIFRSGPRPQGRLGLNVRITSILSHVRHNHERLPAKPRSEISGRALSPRSGLVSLKPRWCRLRGRTASLAERPDKIGWQTWLFPPGAVVLHCDHTTPRPGDKRVPIVCRNCAGQSPERMESRRRRLGVCWPTGFVTRGDRHGRFASNCHPCPQRQGCRRPGRRDAPP
jgi:hypothetical protein